MWIEIEEGFDIPAHSYLLKRLERANGSYLCAIDYGAETSFTSFVLKYDLWYTTLRDEAHSRGDVSLRPASLSENLWTFPKATQFPGKLPVSNISEID